MLLLLVCHAGAALPAQEWVPKNTSPNVWVQEHALAYDSARERIVLFGGDDVASTYCYFRCPPPTATPQAETLEWDGSGWVRYVMPQSPPPRSGHAMAYDAARQRVVLFGGGTCSSSYVTPLGDTWEWDGAAWVQLTPAQSPPAMWGHSMVYDEARQQIVLFGGDDGSGAPHAETWTWDGTTWTQLTPAQSPPAMWHHAMAYDAARQRVLLFGGDTTVTPLGYGGCGPFGCYYYYGSCTTYTGGGMFLADTWEWDGTNWTQLAPAQSPTARGAHAMTYAADRQRVVLFGGMTSGGPLDDTWEWDGTDWTQQSPALTPGVRWGHAMTFDTARQRSVSYGGSDNAYYGYYYYYGSRPANDTWVYGQTIAATTQTYGAGCAGAGMTPPSLNTIGRPFLGNQSFGLDVTSAPAAAPVSLALSGGLGAIPIGGGCTLWLSTSPFFVSIAGQANGSGVAPFSLSIPANPGLMGLSLASQGIVMDATGPFAGITVTNGLRFIVGE